MDGQQIFGYFFQLQHLQSEIMNNDKSVSLGDNSFSANRTVMGITSRQKFQNMEKLTTIVREMEQNSSRPAHPEQILEAIKNNIKNNYNRLYDNYEVNKNAILKSIQQTETNDANGGVMRQKFQSVLKEKNAYDRLKVDVEKKQKKLKKLIEIRDQAMLLTTAREDLKDTLADRSDAIRRLEQHRSILEYETAVLEGMKKQRQLIKLSLKQRNDNLLKEQQLKKEKTKKIIDASHTKKIILDQIEEKIRQQDLCEIPLPLSEELERKLEQYRGKHSQQNILIHEKILSEQKSKREKEQAEQEQEVNRKIKQAKQKEQKREFEIAYNHFLLKQAEEEQIKKFCRVDSITEISSGTVEEEKRNLQFVKQQIEAEISSLNEENKNIRGEIEAIMTSLQDKGADGVSFLELEKILENQETQLRRIKTHAVKKDQVIHEWEGALQAMFPAKADGIGLLERLKNSVAKYERYSIRATEEGGTAAETIQFKPNLSLNKRQNKELKINYQNESSQASEFQI